MDALCADSCRAAYCAELELDRRRGAASRAGAPHRAERSGAQRAGLRFAGGVTVAQPILRVCRQTALIFVAAGIVVAATCALTPRYNPKKGEAAAATKAEKQ